MKSQHTAIWISGLTLLAVASAGCVGDFSGTAAGKGSVVFCVQDDPTVNFNGVFVNFGNIQINQQTTGNNTIDDDEADDTMATDTTDATDTMTSTPTDSLEPTTAETTAAETTDAPETTATVETRATGGDVTTINVEDIDCGRVEAEGTFEGVFRGQAGGSESGSDDDARDCAPENPGCVADERRGRSDSPCDRDQGFGNDHKCETVEVETGDVDVLQFKDRKAAFLAQADLEPGTVQGMCLTVENVRVVTNDGEEVDVDIENGDICLDGPVEVREGQHTLVVFKVDVDQSFAGSSEATIVFNPMIRVQAAAPVTTTITVEETVTHTTSASAANETSASVSDTMSPTATVTSTATTETTQATTATNNTASPTPTTTGP